MEYQYTLKEIMTCVSWDCMSWGLSFVLALGLLLLCVICIGLVILVFWVIKKGIDEYIESKIEEHKKKCKKKR